MTPTHARLLMQSEFEEFADEEMTLGNRAENSLKELHSFTDLTYSKTRVVSGVSWHPTATGVVSFSCTNNLTFEQWVECSGRVLTSAILVWNFSDLLHPEMILDVSDRTPVLLHRLLHADRTGLYPLQVPGNLTCFKVNPHNPDIVAAGLQTGQVRCKHAMLGIGFLSRADSAYRTTRSGLDVGFDGSQGRAGKGNTRRRERDRLGLDAA